MSNTITLEQQIKEIQREIALRKNVYPVVVGKGKLTRDRARYQMDAALAIHTTLILLNGELKGDPAGKYTHTIAELGEK